MPLKRFELQTSIPQDRKLAKSYLYGFVPKFIFSYKHAPARLFQSLAERQLQSKQARKMAGNNSSSSLNV